MNKIEIEEQIRIKFEKGLPVTPQEFGRTVRVLVKAMNTLVEELAKLKELANEVSVPGSKVDTTPSGNGNQTTIRAKSKL